MTTARPLAGQHALVTGAGRGIGAAIAARLAVLGANLSLLGRKEQSLRAVSDRLMQETGIEACTAVADVSDAAAVAQALGLITARLGSLHILVNNAGVADSMPFAKMTDAHWREMIEVNLTGTFNLCRSVLPSMQQANYGRVINVASTAGQKGFPYIAAYCAAKHGVIGLTRALAAEYGKYQISVNAVCPGYVDTDMTKTTIRRIVEKTGKTESEAKALIITGNPQGRLISPEEVASAVGFLALPQSMSITGQALSLSGGEVMT